MAKRIHDEDIRLNIIINGNEAQKEITDLDIQTKKLQSRQKELQAEMKKIPPRLRDTSVEYQKLNKEFKQNNTQIGLNVDKIQKLTSTLKVNEMTQAQLRKRATELRYAMSHMLDGASRNKMKEQLAEVNAQMDKLSTKAMAQRMTFGQAADWLNRYQTMLMSIAATFTGLTYTLDRWIDYQGKLSDAEADVMKTTGMTRAEIDALNESISTFNTRTSRMDLLKIAEEGGRIGIATEEMSGFVKVMDMAAVALGDSFTGGVEEVAGKLGKLKMLFQETRDMSVEDAYMQIGSAINDLGANGVATERNITEFATRLGALPDQLKPSIAEALALGAAFEESGIEAEVSSRAYSIFLNRASTNTAEFARVMGMPVEKVRELINANPLEFFLQFAERLKGINPEATEMAQLLDDLKINADGANKVIGAASSNTQRFRDTIELSNASLADGTSLLNEFNTKNNTFGATLDKIKKTVAGWLTSDTLVSWLTSVVTWFAKFIGAVEDADGSVTGWRNTIITVTKVLLVLTVGLGSYKAAMMLTALWTNRNTAGTLLYNAQLKIQNALAAIAIIRTEGLAIAQMLMAGNVRQAIVQLRLLNATLLASPWGAVIALVGAATTAYILFSKNIDETTEKQRVLNEVHKEATQNIAKEKAELELLLAIARNENVAKADRLNAIKRLNEISPKYLGQLNLENINTQNATRAVELYTQALYDNARAKALAAKYEKLVAEKLDAESKTFKNDYQNPMDKWFDKVTGRESKDYKSRADVEKAVIEKYGKDIVADQKKYTKTVNSWMKSLGLDKKENEIKILDAQIDALGKEIASNETAVKEVTTNTNTSDFSNAGGSSSGKTKSSSTSTKTDPEVEARKRFLEQLKNEEQKYLADILKLQHEYEDLGIDAMDDKFERERVKLSTEHQRTIDALRAQKIDEQNTIDALEKEKSKYTKEEDIAKIDAVIDQIKIKNQEIENLILAEKESYERKLLEIGREYNLKQTDDLLKSIEDRKRALEYAQNEELAKIQTLDQAKEALRGTLSEKELKQIKTFDDARKALDKKHQQERLDAEIESMQKMVDELNRIASGEVIEGVDFNLMSPEQKETFLKNIEEVKNALNLLNIEKAKLSNESPEGDAEKGVIGMDKGSVDIFGMSTDDWKILIDNIENGKIAFQEVVAVVNAMKNAYAQYADLIAQKENRELERYEAYTNRKKDILQSQLDQGYISQETYNREVAKLEDDYNKRKAEIEYKQAKRQRAIDIATTIVNTSMAIMKAYSDLGPIAGTIAAALVGTLGALQIQTIRKQPLPTKGFEDGYYDVIREQDGKKFRAKNGGVAKSGIVNKPTHFLAGEQGQHFPEVIIDGPTWKDFSPQLKQAVISSINGRSAVGFESGYYPVASTTLAQNQTPVDPEIKALISKTNAYLEYLITNGTISFLVDDYDTRKKIAEGQENLKNLKDRAKLKS